MKQINFIKKHKMIRIVLIVCFVVSALLIGWLWHSRSSNGNIFAKYSHIASFTLYHYPDDVPGDFSIVQDKFYISENIFIMPMQNQKGQQITITQQALPPDLKNRKVEGGQKVEGVSGSAVVTRNEGQTIGTFLSDKETLILVNTTDTVDANIFQDLLRSLQPYQ